MNGRFLNMHIGHAVPDASKLGIGSKPSSLSLPLMANQNPSDRTLAGHAPADCQLTDHALAEDLPAWGVLVLESHHSPQFTMEWREHDFLKVVYVLRGRGVLEMQDRVLRFDEGDVVVVPPNTPNRITDAPDAASSLYIGCIAPTLFSFDATLLENLDAGLLSSEPHWSKQVASQLRRMRHQQAGDAGYVALSMVTSALRLLQWLLVRQGSHTTPGGVAMNRGARDDREVIKDYVTRLTTEFYEVTTIDAAAESIGMSRRTFTKLFQEMTGTTWLSYVRALAINHAKHQLAQTNLSIAAVAFECGFNDLSTFYRQFKSQVGSSPKNYRRSIG